MTIKELKERQAWPLRQKIDHSLYVIETFIGRLGADKVYVGFSGGKDSTVLLDLVRMIDKTVPAAFVNTGNEWPEILQFVRHLRDDKGYNIEWLTPDLIPREVWAKVGFPLVGKHQAQFIYRYRKNLSNHLIEEVVSARWRYLFNEPYDVSHLCCKYLKKEPARKYQQETGRYPILGIMASESLLRTMVYVKKGSCNSFAEDNDDRGGK